MDKSLTLNNGLINLCILYELHERSTWNVRSDTNYDSSIYVKFSNLDKSYRFIASPLNLLDYDYL